MTALSGVSVIVPHYGDPRMTLALVEQLLGQVDPPSTQIVVSDDGSPHPMPPGTGYQVVRREINGGFGSAVNSGIAIAEHDAVLVLNSDVTVGPTFLRELVQRARPWWPAVVAAPSGDPDGTALIARCWPRARHHAAEWLVPLARFHGRPWLERAIGNDPSGWQRPHAVLTDWAVGVCLLMPTDEVRAVGGFDERFFMNCEEVDLQRRLHAERGLAVVVLPAPYAEHVGGGSSDPTRRAGWLTDARFTYHEKWSGGPALLLDLMAATTMNAIWNSARSLRGRGTDPLRAARLQGALVIHGWRNRTRGSDR